MTLELTDKNTGAMETATEENMITETVNDILGLNPMGIFYAATGEYDEALLWNGNLLPICPSCYLPLQPPPTCSPQFPLHLTES